MQRAPSGFTLIELLVVVTIIVVLLALLAPALDKAIYAAEMAADAANMHGVATGLGIYAVQNNRYYPYRQYADAGGWWPQWLARPGTDVDDMRRMLRGIVSMKSYSDPFCGKMDFDPASTAGSQVLGNYPIWAGFRFVNNKGMRRIGDRFTWQDMEFNLFVTDWDLRMEGIGSEGNHPDKNDTMRLYITQNQPPTDTALTGNAAIDGNAQGYWTLSRWFDVRNLTPRRGLIDQNYTYQDGSFERMDNLKHNWEDDERLTFVPLEASPSNPGIHKVQVPKP